MWPTFIPIVMLNLARSSALKGIDIKPNSLIRVEVELDQRRLLAPNP